MTAQLLLRRPRRPDAATRDARPAVAHCDFRAHRARGVFSAFSAFAFATFLVPPYPAWLQTPSNQSVMRIGYTYGGQTTVVLGAVAGFAFLASCIGMARTWIVFAVSFVLSLGSELAGTSTGLPFGVYSYTDQLGYKIAGLVPFNIPTSWFYMLVASLAICGRFLPSKDDNLSKWWWALVGGLVLTAWDVSMDPAMVKTTHWLWNVPDLSDAVGVHAVHRHAVLLRHAADELAGLAADRHPRRARHAGPRAAVHVGSRRWRRRGSRSRCTP